MVVLEEDLDIGVATTINQQMLIRYGEGGTTSHMKIEMANTFAETTSATGSATGVTINAPSTVSKMGVIVTYVDLEGTAHFTTDLNFSYQQIMVRTGYSSNFSK